MKNSVKVERAIKNITQQELAEVVGVSRQTSTSSRPVAICLRPSLR